MTISIILTAYVVALAFAAAIRAEGLERNRFSAMGRRRVRHAFWVLAFWQTCAALLAILATLLVGAIP